MPLQVTMDRGDRYTMAKIATSPIWLPLLLALAAGSAGLQGANP